MGLRSACRRTGATLRCFRTAHRPRTCQQSAAQYSLARPPCVRSPVRRGAPEGRACPDHRAGEGVSDHEICFAAPIPRATARAGRAATKPGSARMAFSSRRLPAFLYAIASVTPEMPQGMQGLEPVRLIPCLAIACVLANFCSRPIFGNRERIGRRETFWRKFPSPPPGTPSPLFKDF